MDIEARVLLMVAGVFALGCAQAVKLGDVTFESVRLPLGAGGDYATAADVNGDGHPDLLVSRRGDDELVCFPGDGRGGFGGAVRTPAGANPTTLAPGDFDGDGHVDVAIANHETDHLTLLLGDGRCGFVASPHSPIRLTVRPHPHAVHAADFDGDGRLDLVVDARESEGLQIVPGLRDGRFDTDGPVIRMGGDPYRGMAVGDLDGDGRADLATPNPRELGIALNQPSGTFAFELARPVAADTPFGVAIGDFDGDGRADLVSGSGQSSDRVEVFLGEGGGGFRAHPKSPIAFEAGAKAVTTGDFDSDGYSDAVAASYSADEILVLRGGPRDLEPVRIPGFENPWGLAVADFNGDGYDDLAVVDQGADELTVFMSRYGR